LIHEKGGVGGINPAVGHGGFMAYLLGTWIKNIKLKFRIIFNNIRELRIF